jgi:hypothetical protein
MRIFVFDKLEIPGEEMFVVYVGIYLDELFVVNM